MPRANTTHRPIQLHRDFGPFKMLHAQVRVGKRLNGKRRAIVTVKFRTMGLNAHNQKAEIHFNGNHLEKFNAHDPRVKWWGKLLRKTHGDESPQLLQVLSGELNLVGPRALLKREFDNLPPRIKEIQLKIGSSLAGLQYACRPFPPTDAQYFKMVEKFYKDWRRDKNAATLRYGLLILANISFGGARTK